MPETPPVRRALDWLLARHPHLDVLSIDSQPAHMHTMPGPWKLVDLSDGSRWAIWKQTGAVHAMRDLDGPYGGRVVDDPIFTPKSDEESGVLADGFPVSGGPSDEIVEALYRRERAERGAAG